MQDHAAPTPMLASHQDVQPGGASGYRDMGGHGVLAPQGVPTFPFPVHGAGGYDEPAKQPTRPVPQLRQGVPASSEKYPPVIVPGPPYIFEPGQDIPIKPGAFINADAFITVARQMARAVASPITVPVFYIFQDPRSHLQFSATCNVKTERGNIGPSIYFEQENGEDVWSATFGPKAYWKRFPFFQGYAGGAVSTDPNNRGLAWSVSPSAGKTSGTMGMNPVIADGQTFFQFSILNLMAITFARDTLGLNWNAKDFRDRLYRAVPPRRIHRKLGRLHKARQWMKKKDLDYMCGIGLYVTNPDFVEKSNPLFNNVIDPYLLPAFNTFRKHVLNKSPLPAGYHGRYKDKDKDKVEPGPVWEMPPAVTQLLSKMTSPGLMPMMASLMPSMAPDVEGPEGVDPESLALTMTGLMPMLAALASQVDEEEEEEGLEQSSEDEKVNELAHVRLPGH